MSNIYIQEPPTSGKVLLVTSVGDIDVELWCKECPKTCRNFIQLCMEGYYDNTVFHRLVKGFIVQGGDPQGTGEGGESIYGKTFKDEFHSRLRFNRRGLVGMANAGPDDNGSQFFFTLGPTPELQNKNSLFGKVVGNTLYNMLKLEETAVGKNERPKILHRILSTEVLNNPFEDIVPRELPRRKATEEEEEEDGKPKKKGKKGTKNFKLLSFGDEAEEEESFLEQKDQTRGKAKSIHDLVKNDPKLSSVPAVTDEELASADNEKELSELEKIRKKLKKEMEELDNKDYRKEKKAEQEEKLANLKEEVKSLKRDLKKDKEAKAKAEDQKKRGPDESEDDEEDEVDDPEADEEDPKIKYKKDLKRFAAAKKNEKKKGIDREAQTLAFLARFQAKLDEVKEKGVESDDGEDLDDDKEGNDDQEDESWMRHRMKTSEAELVLAKDANRKAADWYEVTDPRNPITKRRREESKRIMADRKRPRK